MSCSVRSLTEVLLFNHVSPILVLHWHTGQCESYQWGSSFFIILIPHGYILYATFILLTAGEPSVCPVLWVKNFKLILLAKNSFIPHYLPWIYWGFPTRMVYLYCMSCLRYTILVGNPWYVLSKVLCCHMDRELWTTWEKGSKRKQTVNSFH